MSTTPTPAETPTKVVRYDIESMDTTEPPQHVVVEHDEGEYVSWSDYATAQAELTTLREKLVEEQAGAASMREALEEIHKMSRTQGYDSGHTGIETACEKALSSPSGKATLEELERLRSLRHHASLKLTNREDGDGMTGDEILAAIDDMQRKARSDFERIEALRAEVEKAVARTERAIVAGEELLVQRDSALATIAELRAELAAAEASINAAHQVLDNDPSKIIRNAKDGYPEGRKPRILTLAERISAICKYASDYKDWLEAAETARQALQPTAPTEPEKAGSAAPTKEGRERFERWCATRGHKPGVWREHVWRYDNNVVHEMWLAWQESQLPTETPAEPQPATVPLAIDDQLQVLADIRVAVGDPTGKLMQSELVSRIESVFAERKTVHEWLDARGIPTHEATGLKMCLLRRLAVALGVQPHVMEPAPGAKEDGV